MSQSAKKSRSKSKSKWSVSPLSDISPDIGNVDDDLDDYFADDGLEMNA